MKKFSLLRAAAAAKSLGVCLALGAAAAAQATPIVYTFTGLASGSYTPIGGGLTSFSDRALTVSITTDTSNVDFTRFGASTPATNALVPGSISVAGVGSGSFNAGLYVFNNQGNQTVGFGNTANSDLIDLTRLGVGLSTYGLTTAFGPITGTPPNFVAQFQNVGVSFGTLSLSLLNNATFQAAAVPEPETWALMGLGMALVAARASKRREATV